MALSVFSRHQVPKAGTHQSGHMCTWQPVLRGVRAAHSRSQSQSGRAGNASIISANLKEDAGAPPSLHSHLRLPVKSLISNLTIYQAFWHMFLRPWRKEIHLTFMSEFQWRAGQWRSAGCWPPLGVKPLGSVSYYCLPI